MKLRESTRARLPTWALALIIAGAAVLLVAIGVAMWAVYHRRAASKSVTVSNPLRSAAAVGVTGAANVGGVELASRPPLSVPEAGVRI